jgi:hypothetical protein
MATATLTSYTPSYSEIPADRVAAVRARLETLTRAGWPELDTTPNTPFGDLHLTPLAYQIAAVEIAGERMFSDLDLANVAAGVVYNCDFVRAYLQNFAPVPRESAQASGLVRLTFSNDVGRVIDRRALFAFGDGNIFGLRLSGPDALLILPSGQPKTNVNHHVLTQFDRNTFIVDVPVAGIMGTTVTAGATGTADILIPGLVGITAVADFLTGTREDSVSSLAQKTRSTFYSASLTSRGGAVAFIAKEFPQISTASAVVSGDAEMRRDSENPLGVATGCLDLCVRSSQAFLTTTQLVKLTYDSGLDKFVGRLDLAETPVKIDTVVCDTSPEVGLQPTIYSASKNSVRAPLGTAAYSELEQLYLEIPMPRAEDNTRLIITENGDTTAYFNVTYRYDPAARHVSTTLNSSDVKPVGVDVLAKAFTPVVIDSLTVEYVKKPGVQVNIDQARQEILAYFLKLGYPDLYFDSAVGDALLYAGASGVKRVSVSAHVQWSVASKLLTVVDPLSDWAAAVASSRAFPTLTITHAGDLTPTFVDPAIGTVSETLVACGKRNLGYILDSANLNFSEFKP